MKKKTIFAYVTGIAVGASLFAISSFAEASDNGTAINEEIFPDDAFRAYVEQFDKDKNGSLDSTEIAAVTSIDVNGKKIASLKGVELFTKLNKLSCNENDIAELDVAALKELQILSCSDNKLTSLDVTDNTELIMLIAGNFSTEGGGNKYENLDLSNNAKLNYLEAAACGLTSLDISANVNLEKLGCFNNEITELDVSQNVALTSLNCSFNKLKTIDLSKNTKLTSLDCGYNQLTSLDLSNNPLITSEYPSVGNKYDLGECSEFDLKELEQYGFDLSKVVDDHFVGAELKDGKLVNFNDIADENEILYAYDLGNGKTTNFTLTYTPKAEEITSSEENTSTEESKETDASTNSSDEPGESETAESEGTQPTASDSGENNGDNKGENKPTGLAIAFVPSIAAAAAIVIARRRK